MPEQGYFSQAPGERPGNRLYDESGTGVIIHELGKDDSASQLLVDATGGSHCSCCYGGVASRNQREHDGQSII